MEILSVHDESGDDISVSSSRSTSSRRRKRRNTVEAGKNHLDNETKSMYKKNKTASNHFKRFISTNDAYKSFIDVQNIPVYTDYDFLVRMLGELYY